ncbi:beta-ribofuranosylaminobenzene 5'-phosphate synthase family protein [Methylopila henanensis]|uniref:Beta-ribofuranosylaminobenzene 5'-phosphate synthase family protein n=1 Tax=Methylopila henanensis TaxID=873516 RepID=A0ABW4K0Z5_9HYPH
MTEHDPHSQPPPPGAEAPHAVTVRAPGRLHVGFLDLGGALGRRFGGLGVSLDSPATVVTLEAAKRRSAKGPDAHRAEAALSAVADAFGLDDRVAVTVNEALPAHSGLGSGTQLGLAVGVGLARLRGVDLTPRQVAEALGRGQRSSIGLGAFESGGVILDGGRGALDAPPPIISRIPIPAGWRILLIYDRGLAGLSGSRETTAMASLPPFPESLADRLCRLATLGALPAAAEGDANAFGRAVGEMQRLLGDHFARAQGGRFTSPDVADALAAIEQAGVPGVGQSSWGPTGFAILGDAGEAAELAAAMRRRFADRPNLAFEIVRGASRGADIALRSAAAPDGLALTGDANVRR